MSPQRHTAAGVFVRTFLPQDAQAVQEIASRSPEAAQWSCASYAALNDSLCCAWVAEVDGTIDGFFVARVAADEAEILNLAVTPAKRCTGIATALLKEALAELQAQGAHNVSLEVRESNHAAIHFYEKHGFVKTGRRTAYYQGPTEAAVLMKRELTG